MQTFDVRAPKALMYNIHSLMMMQRQVKEVFHLIHDTNGFNKFKECFLTDIDLANEDFITIKLSHAYQILLTRIIPPNHGIASPILITLLSP